MKPAIKKGYVIWFTGLSGAGKTTLAKLLREELNKLNINNSWAWAAGGMVVNAEELAALLDGLIKGQILDDQIVAAMIDTTVAQKNPDDENGPAFGLGLMHRGMKPSVHAYGHDGEALGYASLVYHIPTFDLTIAILSNGSGHELKLFNIFQQVFSLVDVSGQTLF